MPTFTQVSTLTRLLCHRLNRHRQVALIFPVILGLLAGCTPGKWGFPYRAPIQQGNWITQEQVALLRTGMTREQVRFALGSPTLPDVLRADRWDYPYYYKLGYHPAQQRNFTVWFKENQLVRWEGDRQPDLQPFQITDPVPDSVTAPTPTSTDPPPPTAGPNTPGSESDDDLQTSPFP